MNSHKCPACGFQFSDKDEKQANEDHAFGRFARGDLSDVIKVDPDEPQYNYVTNYSQDENGFIVRTLSGGPGNKSVMVSHWVRGEDGQWHYRTDLTPGDLTDE